MTKFSGSRGTVCFGSQEFPVSSWDLEIPWLKHNQDVFCLANKIANILLRNKTLKKRFWREWELTTKRIPKKRKRKNPRKKIDNAIARNLYGSSRVQVGNKSVGYGSVGAWSAKWSRTATLEITSVEFLDEGAGVRGPGVQASCILRELPQQGHTAP